LRDEGFFVNPRTIERDLIKLSQYFDIEADKREKPYGWAWSPFVKGLNVPGMTMSQAVTFTLAQARLKLLLPVLILEQLAPFFQRAETALNNLNEVAASKWPEKVRVIHATQILLPPHIDEIVQEAVFFADY
jgi:hypothetical protein